MNTSLRQPLYKFLLAGTLSLVGCSPSQPLLDKHGRSPEDAMMIAYEAAMTGDWQPMQILVSPSYLEAINPNDLPFETAMDQYETLSTWTRTNLRTQLVGNDIHPEMWRVRIYSDDGLGASNPAGIVHDLVMIDGEWRIVFWGDYAN